MLAVNNYDEFLKLVEVISGSYNVKPEELSLNQPSIIVLVGPSGSGKNDIAKGLLEKRDCFEKLVSYTTDEGAVSRPEQSYRHVSLEEFRKMCDDGDIFESTTYGRHAYGSRKSDVEKILGSGKHVLTVMDICGAMAMKTHFPNVVTIYVKRDKKDLLTALLEKDAPTPDKVNRILAIEAETKNAHICDYTVNFDSCENAVAQICEKLHLK